LKKLHIGMANNWWLLFDLQTL